MQGCALIPFYSPKQNALPDHHAANPMQSGRHHRLSIMNKRTDPVTVVFGRPDICVYLSETFAKETEAPAARGESGLDTAGPLVDVAVSTTDTARATGPPRRHVSGYDHLHYLHATDL